MSGQDWDCRITAISQDFAKAGPGDGAMLLRALHTAILGAPHPVADALGAPCDGKDIDRLLSIDCLHDAAFALTGRAGLMLSKSPSGEVIATIIADGLFGETDYRAGSIPLAIGGALSAGLASWADAAITPSFSRATH